MKFSERLRSPLMASKNPTGKPRNNKSGNFLFSQRLVRRGVHLSPALSGIRRTHSRLRAVQHDPPRATPLEGDAGAEVVREHLPHGHGVDEVRLCQVLGGHAVPAGDVRLDRLKVHNDIVGLRHDRIS